MNEPQNISPDLLTNRSAHNAVKSLYERPLLVQWVVALLLAGIAVALVGIAAFGSACLLGLHVDSPPQLLLALLAVVVPFLPIWMLINSLFFTPLLRLAGILRYYSPFLIVSRAKRGRLDLHGAMPFDYVMLFRWRDRGRSAARLIILWYVDGLVALAREIEQGRIPGDTEISATSYIFSAHSFRRFGFKVESTPRLAFGGVLTYPTQFLTYSFAQGRWSLPPILRAYKASIDATQLCSRIDQLQRLQKHLRITQTHPSETSQSS